MPSALGLFSNFLSLTPMTHNQLRVAIECRKGVKVKVVKWCWKKWSGPILMHIYAKQCEIMQKIDEKAPTVKFTVLQGEISSVVLKTWKTRKTNTWITQIFQILYPTQGGTMWTLTSSAFRQCGTFWAWQFLKGGYWLSKLSHFSIFSTAKNLSKKVTRSKNDF